MCTSMNSAQLVLELVYRGICNVHVLARVSHGGAALVQRASECSQRRAQTEVWQRRLRRLRNAGVLEILFNDFVKPRDARAEKVVLKPLDRGQGRRVLAQRIHRRQRPCRIHEYDLDVRGGLLRRKEAHDPLFDPSLQPWRVCGRDYEEESRERAECPLQHREGGGSGVPQDNGQVCGQQSSRTESVCCSRAQLNELGRTGKLLEKCRCHTDSGRVVGTVRMSRAC
jgi:hypothetical protein